MPLEATDKLTDTDYDDLFCLAQSIKDTAEELEAVLGNEDPTVDEIHALVGAVHAALQEFDVAFVATIGLELL